MHMKDDKVHQCQEHLTDHTGHACETCHQGPHRQVRLKSAPPGQLEGALPITAPTPCDPQDDRREPFTIVGDREREEAVKL